MGQRGMEHLERMRNATGRVEIRAVADVYAPRRRRARDAAGGDCAEHLDYRAILERADIDGLIITVPTQWHSRIAIDACRAAKHVYCETPLARTIEEAQRIVETVDDSGIVFATSAPQRYHPHARTMHALCADGGAERITRIDIGCGRGQIDDTERVEPIPEGLDWEMWLGPARWSEYSPKRFQTYRWFYDYAGGTLTDSGAPFMDLVLWSMPNLISESVTIEPVRAEFPHVGIYDTAVEFKLIYRFENGVEWHVSSDEPGMHVHMEDERVARVGALCDPIGPGTEGGTGMEGTAGGDSLMDWLHCIREDRVPDSDARAGSAAAIMCHLGNIALRTGRTVRWDPKAGRIADDGILNRWLTTPYRAPWRL